MRGGARGPARIGPPANGSGRVEAQLRRGRSKSGERSGLFRAAIGQRVGPAEILPALRDRRRRVWSRRREIRARTRTEGDRAQGHRSSACRRDRRSARFRPGWCWCWNRCRTPSRAAPARRGSGTLQPGSATVASVFPPANQQLRCRLCMAFAWLSPRVRRNRDADVAREQLLAGVADAKKMARPAGD